MKEKFPNLNTIGNTYHDFVVTKAIEIPELQCFLRELIHSPTGAKVMHIANDDPENVFCLSFQTLPDSSNGVAHILEHTVLCGSKKFPLKDPFFAMSRRSLHTFMNALTGSDFTCYPAASQVEHDFYNLLEVYLDAVFHPILDRKSFLQEGHRLEFTNPKDPQSPLQYKGVVLNEMKGSLTSGSARMAEEICSALFPDLAYGKNSGGNPKDIPNLSYEELLDFHKKHYHPSRCLFYFYGNFPLENHLDFIEEHALTGVDKAGDLPEIPSQPRFEKPVRVQTAYPISPEEDPHKKTMITFGWLTCDILEQTEILALTILSVALCQTDASPLKAALLKSGLCKQVSCSIDTDISEIPIILSLRGCSAEDADEIERILFTTVEGICKTGIPSEKIHHAMHQLEIHRSEIGEDHYPFGLSLFMRSGLLRQHGAEPEEGLMIHSLFEKIRNNIDNDPDYMTKLVRKYLLDNPHFARVVMLPDLSLGKREIEEERAVLENIRRKLTEDEELQIIQQAEDLEEFQREQEEKSFDVLPTVTLDDVPLSAKEYPLNREKAGHLEVFHHAVFTNEIVYADLVMSLPHVELEDLPYVRLLAVVMSQMGCGGRGYSENLDFIQANTGGVGASLSLNLQAHDFRMMSPLFILRGKALHRKVDKLLPLMNDMAATLDLQDYGRLQEVLHKHFTGLEGSLNQNSLRYAINHSASCLDSAGLIANEWYGLDYYWAVRKIVGEVDNNPQKVADKLQRIRDQVLSMNDLHLILSCDDKIYGKMKENAFYGLQDTPRRTHIDWKGDYQRSSIQPQGRVIASPVAFNSIVFKTVPYTHPDSAALNIAAHLFDNITLHKLLREKGGAYGGGAFSSSLSGNFCFFSYRDPNIVKTLDAFQTSVRDVLAGDFDESDLEEAKLEIIQVFDSPTPPGMKADLGYSWYRCGKTLELRQEHRNKMLAHTKTEVMRAVEKHVVSGLESGKMVAFASRDLLEKENATFTSQGKAELIIESV